MTDKVKNAILIMLAVVVAYYVVATVISWLNPKKPIVTTTIKYVPDTLTAKIMGFKIDSLNGIIESKDIVIGAAKKLSSTWKKRAMRLDSVVASMRDTTTDSLHTLDATLNTIVQSDPDSAGTVYNDSLKVQYDIGFDVWHDIKLGLEKRKIPYFKEVIETITEVPYIPMWVVYPVAAIILILTGAVLFN